MVILYVQAKGKRIVGYMYNYILEAGVGARRALSDKSIWNVALKGLIDRTKVSLEGNKILVFTHKSFPPPFAEDFFEYYAESLSKDFDNFKLMNTNQISEIKAFFERFLNQEETGVLICSQQTWTEISRKGWFPFVRQFCKNLDRAKNMPIDLDSFMSNFEEIISIGYTGLSANMAEIASSFDLAQLSFIPVVVSYCRILGIEEIDTEDFEKIFNFIDSFVDCGGFFFPNFQVLQKMIKDSKFSPLVCEPLGIKRETLELLSHQSLLNIEIYADLKVSRFLKENSRTDVSGLNRLERIYSRRFNEERRSFLEHYEKDEHPSIPWFIARFFLESYFARGTEPKISDHDLAYRYWNSYPSDPEKETRFEDVVLSLAAELWNVDVKRKELTELGDRLWQDRVIPVFLDPFVLRPTVADQKEFMRSVTNEIVENLLNRWQRSESERMRQMNGELLLKVREILSILHILTEVEGDVLSFVNQEVNARRSSLFKIIERIAENSQGEDADSEYVKRYVSFLTPFSQVHRIWTTVLRHSQDLEEASSLFERIRGSALSSKMLSGFCELWADNLRQDIEREQKKQRINPKKWATLSRRYLSLNKELILGLRQNRLTFPSITRTVALALQKLSQVHTVFVLIVDSMSYIDWCAIKKGLPLEDVKISDSFALGVVPTETSVGHAAIFSGNQPRVCGVTGRTFMGSDNDVFETATKGKEDDTHLTVGVERREYSRSNLHRILKSQNLNLNCVVISPFRGTKLTQILKALISDLSQFIEDLDYKEDRPFEETKKWISEKILSLKRKDFYNKLVLVQFPNIDERGHRGEWDEYIYFEKMEQELNGILHDLKEKASRENIKIGVLITSDHGKMLRWETSRLNEILGRETEGIRLPTIKKIIKDVIYRVPHKIEPVSSAKYVMGWLEGDCEEVKNQIVSKLMSNLNIDIEADPGFEIFINEQLAELMGGKRNPNIIYPNFFGVSVFEFTGPGKMQHSGLSLGELLVPFVYMEVFGE